jgi:hypothetical protein
MGSGLLPREERQHCLPNYKTVHRRFQAWGQSENCAVFRLTSPTNFALGVLDEERRATVGPRLSSHVASKYLFLIWLAHNF